MDAYARKAAAAGTGQSRLPLLLWRRFFRFHEWNAQSQIDGRIVGSVKVIDVHLGRRQITNMVKVLTALADRSTTTPVAATVPSGILLAREATGLYRQAAQYF